MSSLLGTVSWEIHSRGFGEEEEIQDHVTFLDKAVEEKM
jgi:hypothetical protein